jgi:hypothetical protein
MAMTKGGSWLMAVSLAVACGGAAGDPAAGSASAARAADPGGGGGEASRGESERTVTFRRLMGVPRPYTGPANAIRGIGGGGLPWVVARGSARLDADGTLHAQVEGLVFDPADAAVQARGVGGTNTVAQLEAIVSCLSVQDGAAVTVNVASAPVPFSLGAATAGGGDAEIEETLALPSPCLAPIVFLASPAGAWFAASAL